MNEQDFSELPLSKKEIKVFLAVYLFFKRFAASMVFSFLVLILISVLNITHVLISIEVLLSFFLYQIGQFFFKRLLEKRLNFDDFTYITQSFSIIFRSILFFLLIPIFLLISNYKGLINHPWLPQNSVEKTLSNDPFFWILFLGVFIFTYRVKTLKKKLLTLQAFFRGKKNEKPNIP